MRFKTINRIVIVLGTGFVIVMALLILWGIQLCSQLNTEVDEKGVKGIIEELWEGKPTE